MLSVPVHQLGQAGERVPVTLFVNIDENEAEPHAPEKAVYT